ncbi:hypothetical protein [Liquorilactobacillus hordei]|uniref:hypothetical protein n=1 Tax=Liquorilactobacillus hordei TaxID=468911 RepID=UPI0039EC0C11
MWLEGNQILGKVEDFTPTQEKIEMTVAEKKEFDRLKGTYVTVSNALWEIRNDPNSRLNGKLYHATLNLCNTNQLKFVRAWEHPELIEVIHEDVRIVKVAGMYLWKHAAEPHLSYDFDIRNEGYYFTKTEVKNINKEDKFKNVDLVAAWEEENE